MKRQHTILAAMIGIGLSAISHAELMISEYVEGSSYNKAVELYNSGAQSIDLSSYALNFYFNSNTAPGKKIPLSGTLLAGETYVVAHSNSDPGLANLAQLLNGGSWFNGDDAVTLEHSGVVIDSVGQIGVDPGSFWGTNTLKTQDMSLRRNSVSYDANALDSFDPAASWNGTLIDDFSDLGVFSGGNTQPGVEIGACNDNATLIHAIQGNGTSSNMLNNQVVIEAVVVGDFQNSDQLNGFFVQEEATDHDTDNTTSEGLFIYEGGFETPLTIGDKVRVLATVQEFGGKTQLANITDVLVCDSGLNIQPTMLSLPLSNADALESYEGMLVSFNQELVVTENYNLARYGELVLSGTDRLFQPTQLYRPGSQAQQLAADNALNRIIMDDGQTGQNPVQVVYPTGGLSADNTIRSGDKVTSLVGVLDEAFAAYRVQPTQAPSFTHINQRTSQPQISSLGNLRLASFNVLNYFNGDGQGGGFPTSRGADTLNEFNRQRAKIINAILAMDADIIGIMEMENDGFGADSAIQDLVSGLNASSGAGVSYSFVDPGLSQIGTDEITVGLIYRNETVEETGQAVTTSTYPFDAKNRQPLVQTFRHLASGEELTVSVNHFKSKGSCPTDGSLDEDQGDWQGCWNARRTAASEYMAQWLATNPTGVSDDDIVIMGDLNAYAMEDPVYELEQAGYVNIARQLKGNKAYSYVFTGLAGSLDHVMVSSSLVNKIVDVTDWHINADEPRALDYNEEFKTPEQINNFYSSAAYRASDHDPIVVEIDASSQNNQPGETVIYDGLSGARRSWTDIPVSISSGVNTLQVSLTGGTGDADLYVMFNALPDRSNFDCRSYNNTNEEICTITNPQAGDWYISLYGFKDYSNTTLTISIQ
ncbi:ExeM/NucH family extracellular endonuclease [Kangiella aquimarina]|uniref:ExeM/NucH family extracellular endonuclease n=1 Tax=Kangiella aquimarina TaxID=261965 RepID=A0ABZ0X6H6_9GAMM|nr:ExeM/NucH family extracellular endonuclease [Kangiella aquimarina]WQG86125.1 ExeM/NucH family extracellular endonuclease [Kangiella aquimarina]